MGYIKVQRVLYWRHFCGDVAWNHNPTPFLHLLWRTLCVKRRSALRSWRRPWGRVFRSPLSGRWCWHRRRRPGHFRRNRYKKHTHTQMTVLYKSSHRSTHTAHAYLYTDKGERLLLLRFFPPYPFAASVVFVLLPSPPSSPLASVSFSVLSFWFSLVFSLLHTASQKHSLKPMHESNLAQIKLSKVWAQCVWPPTLTGVDTVTTTPLRFMQSHTTTLQFFWTFMLLDCIIL